jgi:hypothetical protein
MPLGQSRAGRECIRSSSPPVYLCGRVSRYNRHMEDDLQDVIDQGNDELTKARAQRLADITEGDIEVDPDLMDVGDEVADEVVSEFVKFAGNKRHGVALVQNRGKGRKGVHGSKFTDIEQQAACQRAMDIVLEQFIPPSKAYEMVGAELGVGASTIKQWAYSHGIVPDPTNARSSGMQRGQTWDLFKRERIFDELLDVAQMLTTRMKVWIQYNPNNPDPNTLPPPDDWNAANELKTIAVAAAIAHDKRTGIEDIMVSRGLRDVDSEELQGELSAGKDRLALMGGSNGEQEVRDESFIEAEVQPGD